MIGNVTIKNYKSVQNLELDLGRVTVLIGENGCGKSNILEAIAMCSAAAGNKLDHEFLASRGIRVPDDPRFMRSAFEVQKTAEDITIAISARQEIRTESDAANKVLTYDCVLHNEVNSPYSNWSNIASDGFEPSAKANVALREEIQSINKVKFSEEMIQAILREMNRIRSIPLGLQEFLIYSPVNSSLRTFETEGQIQPLGINGEGLFKLLTVLGTKSNRERLTEIKKQLTLVDWFGDFEVVRSSSTGEKNINIRDKFLDQTLAYFTQKSANEGFLFLLFYFTLFISWETPLFFAIDNVDASLNPKLCSRLVKDLVVLSKKHEKQAILTTHNPAILDGLDLNDDEQRLYVVYRNKLGQTKVTRIHKSEPIAGQPPVRLSEAFLRGYLGGLPRNF